jgi:Domain of unknown function (DUF4157)
VTPSRDAAPQGDRRRGADVHALPVRRPRPAATPTREDKPREMGPSIVGDVLDSTAAPLDPAARTFMEARFGHDFGSVRVHADAVADAAARAVRARAFTVGRDLVFAGGQYDPRSFHGKQLLAHELTHVVQQRAPDTAWPSAGLAEGEADRVSRRVLTAGRGDAVPRVAGTAPPHLAAATFKVGAAKVNVDYGDVVSVADGSYLTEIEARIESWTAAPVAAAVHADLAALTRQQLRWVLFALDLHSANPVAGFDGSAGVRRLIDHAPHARTRPLTGVAAGFWDFEQEALTVSGWFEIALTSNLAAPTGPRLSKAQRLIDPGGAAPGSSECPSSRDPRDQLDVAKLVAKLPKLLEDHLTKVAPPVVVASQPIVSLLPAADVLQEEATSLFAPYANQGRGRGNLRLEQWQFAANLVESTSPQAAPDRDKRMAYLDSRARRVGGDGLFREVKFDSRCGADEAALEAILAGMESRPAISALVDRILQQLSYTEHAATPKRVVLNTQFDPGRTEECEARWKTVNTMCHELVHVMAHDEFREAAAGRQILIEGFTEVLGDQLYTAVVRRAERDAAFRAPLERGLAGAPCAWLPSAETGYGEAGRDAEQLRVVVGNDRFRAAYFLGRLELVGLRPRRAAAVPGDDAEEREAVHAEQRLATGTTAVPTSGAPPSAVQPRPAPQVPAGLRGLLAGLGSGRNLDAPVRLDMEARFGVELGQVRVHTDDRADASARGLHALAYTVGDHMVFASGRYAPSSIAGRALLRHELTHVVAQQAGGPPRVQRAPAPGPSRIGPLQLPWTGQGHTLFQLTANGIRVLVAVRDEFEQSIRAAVSAITKRIAADNALITDPAARVNTCIIAPTTTRFARYQGEPVLMLDPPDANATTAAHEMGHALFDHLGTRGRATGAVAGKAHNLLLRVADIFVRLASTKVYTAKATAGAEEGHPAGHWMVDPSQWSPGTKAEHPWQDPDEFFASGKAAHQTNRAALVRTIARFAKFDERVRAPGNELVALLDDLLGKGTLPAAGPPASRTEAARSALETITGVSNVEKTLSRKTALGWLLIPESRPEPEETGPAEEISARTPPRTKQEDLVTGKGGVVERMELQFRRRLREKAMESAEDLP